jgi:5-methylcytosine-specific restriction endonuclease McrA
MRQHHTKVHSERLPNRQCVDCGASFYDPKSQRKFCERCNPQAGENNGNWKDAKETANCRTCGSEFEYYPSNKKGTFCPDCVESAEGLLPESYPKPIDRVTTTCRYCGGEIHVLPSQVATNKRGFFCDSDCYGKWLSENIVGENHHQWEGGAVAYGKKWWRIRREALERDGHRCQHCGVGATELGQEPDVHHITPVREFDQPSKAHTLQNVISLCRPCHRRAEAGEIEVTEIAVGR